MSLPHFRINENEPIVDSEGRTFVTGQHRIAEDYHGYGLDEFIADKKAGKIQEIDSLDDPFYTGPGYQAIYDADLVRESEVEESVITDADTITNLSANDLIGLRAYFESGTLPGGVENLAASVGTTTQAAALSWDLPLFNGGSSLTGYKVGYKVASSTGAYTQSTINNGASTSASVTGLTNNTEYSFQIIATNANGDGYAVVINATPVAP